jgi:hypothetical protein
MQNGLCAIWKSTVFIAPERMALAGFVSALNGTAMMAPVDLLQEKRLPVKGLLDAPVPFPANSGLLAATVCRCSKSQPNQ